METKEIVQEINKLPFTERISVIEKALKSLKILKENSNISMQKASEILYNDYKTDKELTAFTSIDFDKFYEAK